MKTEKHYWNKNIEQFFNYVIVIDNHDILIDHGLENIQNERIGYNYQNQRKGFWLNYSKVM